MDESTSAMNVKVRQLPIIVVISQHVDASHFRIIFIQILVVDVIVVVR